MARAGEEVGHGAVFDHQPGIQDAQPLANLAHHAKVMGDEQKGRAVPRLHPGDQAQVLNLLERLVAELGLTLAFISHDLSVIRRLCQRTIVLQQGRIVEDRPTAQLFADRKAAYTRELLEAIPLPDPDQVWG